MRWAGSTNGFDEIKHGSSRNLTRHFRCLSSDLRAILNILCIQNVRICEIGSSGIIYFIGSVYRIVLNDNKKLTELLFEERIES